jgi:Mg-chelatase subunit ChlD
MSDSNEGGFVTTERTGPDEVTTVVVTSDGVTAHRIPGGFTEDELLD